MTPLIPDGSMLQNYYGRIEHDGVRMEKVLIEELPGQHATLQVYRSAACAAGIDRSGVDRIRLFNLPHSWAECCGGADLRWPQSHLIPGMLKVFDLPDLYRVLGDRYDFSAADFLDGMLRPVRNE